jgi:hypothetical protein
MTFWTAAESSANNNFLPAINFFSGSCSGAYLRQRLQFEPSTRKKTASRVLSRKPEKDRQRDGLLAYWVFIPPDQTFSIPIWK